MFPLPTLLLLLPSSLPFSPLLGMMKSQTRRKMQPTNQSIPPTDRGTSRSRSEVREGERGGYGSADSLERGKKGGSFPFRFRPHSRNGRGRGREGTFGPFQGCIPLLLLLDRSVDRIHSSSLSKKEKKKPDSIREVSQTTRRN